MKKTSFDSRLQKDLFPDMPASFERGLKKTMEQAGVKPGKRLTAAGIFTGAVSVAVVAACLVIVFIGITGRNKSKANAAAPGQHDMTTQTVSNPWEETTAEELAQFPGVTFGIPEGAENIEYRLLRADALAEMQFTWHDLQYCARIKPEAEFVDISGLYYDWTHEMPCRISWCEGVDRRYIGEDETVDVSLWYDAVSGLMYSVSASAPSLDGFDIGAAADWLYMPARGKTEPFPMEDALALLTESTGYAGSAGGSLKGAIAANRALAFAVDWAPLSWDRQTIYAAFVEAFMALDADCVEEFPGNLENIEWLIDTAFDDYEAVAGLFEDSGTAESMAALLSNPSARTQWNALDSLLSELAGWQAK